MQKLRNLIRRALWRTLSVLPERDLTLATSHGKLTFSSRDRFIGQSLFVRREYGLSEIENALAILRREGLLKEVGRGYLIDIGANIGTVCLSLVRSGAFTHAVAFEPDVTNHRYLARNVEQNDLSERILARRLGLSSIEGELPFELSGDNLGDHRVRLTKSAVPGAYDEEGRRVTSVPARRLDDALASVEFDGMRPGLIWMDVQGHEGHVLAGAPSTLGSGVPIVMEFWPYGLERAGTAPEELTQLLCDSFSYLYDLREPESPKRPIGEVRDLFGRYAGTRGTDLLLVPKG